MWLWGLGLSCVKFLFTCLSPLCPREGSGHEKNYAVSLRFEYLFELFGCLFTHLFTQPFIDISLVTHEYSFSTLNIAQYRVICFVLGQWELFKLAVLTHSIPVGWFLGTFLFSGTMRYSRIILPVSYPSPRISHFPIYTWFCWLENGMGNQDLGTRCALHYYSVVAVVIVIILNSQLAEQGNTWAWVCMWVNISMTITDT